MDTTPLRSFFKESFTPPDYSVDNQHNIKRIEFFDLAKGVFLIAMISLHMGHKLHPVIDVVFMPIFFVMAGAVFKDYGGLSATAIKKANQLLVPFIFFYVLGFIVFECRSYGMCGQFRAAAIFDFIRGYMYFDNPSIWFLVSLFWCYMLYALAARYIKNPTGMAVFCLLCGCAGYLLDAHGLRLYYFSDTALSAMPFFALGAFLRGTPLFFPWKHDRALAFVSFVVLAALFVLTANNAPFSFSAKPNIFNASPFVVYPLTILLIICSFAVLKQIRWLPIVSYLGKYSLIVLCVHRLVQQVLEVIGFKPITVEIVVAVVLSCWLAIPVCRVLFPKFTAQQPLFSFKKRSSAVKA